MHMADALVSPAVGGAMWAVSAGVIGYCSTRVDKSLDDRTVPLMGVLGAFVFAVQMINFAIPATGSSGHLGGGLLLAVLLGPYAAFLTISSILTVQALLFADGGILALGCNIFNLGFFPCIIVYPLIYKPITRTNPSSTGIFIGSLTAAIIGLQLGSLGVVLQTLLSGITDMSMQTFILFMQPIHLAIGIVEGLATASIILFISNARPDILHFPMHSGRYSKVPIRKPLALFLFAALSTGCVLSLFASNLPDGLEWSLFKTTGTEEVTGPTSTIHDTLAGVQEKTALFPAYGFKEPAAHLPSGRNPFSLAITEESGTSLSGFTGSLLTLLIASLVGILLKRRKIPGRNS
ncbi:MAG: energy-coupling factor ABC transporter permease [Desulfobulbaceae bacterium]|nr:energy-coupling factor ABC transporter permease [Desulfobulbaceae bacterium]